MKSTLKSTWKIFNLKRRPDTGLVFEVTWIVNFELEGEGARKIGTTQLQGSVEDPGFVPFEDLTEETVIQWVKSNLGLETIGEIEAQYQTELENRIQNKTAPEFLLGIPWEKNLRPKTPGVDIKG